VKIRKTVRFLGYLIALSPSIPAILTLIPSTARKVNGFGYYSICSFAPYSTLILVGISLATLGLVVLAERLLRSVLRNTQ
jgi:hypothetical protein